MILEKDIRAPDYTIRYVLVILFGRSHTIKLTCIQIPLCFSIVFIISQPAVTRENPALVMYEDHDLLEVPSCSQASSVMTDSNLLQLHRGAKATQYLARQLKRQNSRKKTRI